MRPFTILLTGLASVLAIGAAVAPAYAATPDSDGVTVLTAPQAAPAAPTPATPPKLQMEQVRLSDGDTITAPAGVVITTAMDPNTGDFTTVVTVPGQ